jgi:hypothetical protein
VRQSFALSGEGIGAETPSQNGDARPEKRGKIIGEPCA